MRMGLACWSKHCAGEILNYLVAEGIEGGRLGNKCSPASSPPTSRSDAFTGLNGDQEISSTPVFPTLYFRSQRQVITAPASGSKGRAQKHTQPPCRAGFP